MKAKDRCFPTRPRAPQDVRYVERPDNTVYGTIPRSGCHLLYDAFPELSADGASWRAIVYKTILRSGPEKSGSQRISVRYLNNKGEAEGEGLEALAANGMVVPAPTPRRSKRSRQVKRAS